MAADATHYLRHSGFVIRHSFVIRH